MAKSKGRVRQTRCAGNARGRVLVHWCWRGKGCATNVKYKHLCYDERGRAEMTNRAAGPVTCLTCLGEAQTTTVVSRWNKYIWTRGT